MPRESLRSKRLVHKLFCICQLSVGTELAILESDYGGYQTDSQPRIVIVGGVLGVSAMPRSRERKMVRLMFIGHTY